MIREYECPKCGKFEKIFTGQFDKESEKCPDCGRSSPKIEWSIPSRRNPDAGIQR
jgi:putative FmdB family regulatory protein